jgi:hypothetical protein
MNEIKGLHDFSDIATRVDTYRGPCVNGNHGPGTHVITDDCAHGVRAERPIARWAMRAAERAFTEAIRWNEGGGPFDTEKVARIIQHEQESQVPEGRQWR